MQYGWAPGAPFGGDADEVQAEIERIKRTPGGVTPDSIVACARPSRSVLHPLIFNVDKTEAANRYYLSRAATLLSAIRIVNEEGEVTHLRANVLVREGTERVYRSIDDGAARAQREGWLRGRLVSIEAELRELNLYPSVQLAIQEVLAA